MVRAVGEPSGGTYTWYTRRVTSENVSGQTITVSAKEPGRASLRVEYEVELENGPCTKFSTCAQFLVWRCVLKKAPPAFACPQNDVHVEVDAGNIPDGTVHWSVLDAKNQEELLSLQGFSFGFTITGFGDLILRARFMNDQEIVREINYPIEIDIDQCIKGGGQGPKDCEAMRAGAQLSKQYTDPVTLFNGEFLHEQEDLFIPGRGMDFRLVRTYRSKTGARDADPLATAGAMGNNWDHSYNLRVVRPEGSSDELVFMDGTGRRDIFSLNGGVYTRPEYHTPMRIDPDRVRYSTGDGTMYVFFLPDSAAGPSRGKIETITDRHGNTMTFMYDALGRLRQVHDTLERVIEFGYAIGDAKIKTVTDFTGRTVQYTYYGANDLDGNLGDLRAATLPGFVSTPSFPIEAVHEAFTSGREWRYTYYTGDAPNETNLKEVIDPRGAVATVNHYSSETDPEGFMFDRVVRQERAGLEYRYGYEPVTGEPGLIGKSCRAWVIGRAGRVCEFVYDDLFRLRRKTEYTGLYDGEPWSGGAPSRGPKLRTEDPDSFTWKYSYNGDSQMTREVLPSGNAIISVYDSTNPDPRRRGNRLRRFRVADGSTHSCTPGDCIEERWEYEFSFNGAGSACCGGWGFPTAHIDPMGRRTEFEYDPNTGDLLTIRYPVVTGATTLDGQAQTAVETREYNAFGQITRRTGPGPTTQALVETFAYYDGSEGAAFEAMLGRLKSRTTAPDSLSLSTGYEYDAAGNVVAVIDPSGHRAEMLYNQANLLVRELSRPTQTGGSIRHRRDLFYDAALNNSRIDVENRDSAGALGANTSFSTWFEHDSINRLTRITREVDGSTSVVEEMDYDGNDEVIEIRKGASFQGQPDNILTRVFDERGLLLTETRGGQSDEASTTRFAYDLNGNVSLVTRGFESTDESSSAFAYDDYDRLIASLDAMGNYINREYDVAGNLTRLSVEGQLLDEPIGSGGPDVLLAESMYRYDERHRLVDSRDRIFEPSLGHGANDAWASTRFYYRADSLLARTVDPDMTVSDREYDFAQRLLRVTDHEQNSESYTYDARSNVIAVERVDRGDEPSVPPNAYRSEMVYDPLDRLSESSDVWRGGPVPNKNTTKFAYDSRGNIVKRTDPRQNVTTFAYDGLSRPIQTDRLLNPSGTERITTSSQWDASSRLVARTDGLGHATRFAYDALDRSIVVRFADGTIDQVGSGATWVNAASAPDLSSYASGYDARGNAVTTTDARGSVITSTFDALDRVVTRTIAPGAGVVGDLSESFAYDGRSLAVMLSDSDSEVLRAYDSRARLTEESQRLIGVPGLASSEATVSYFYQPDGDLIRTVYPGGRMVFREYDRLDRLIRINSNPSPEGTIGRFVAGYRHIGGRVRERSTRFTRSTITYNGVIDRYNAQHDFGVGRVATIVHQQAIPAPNVPGGVAHLLSEAHTFFWDRAQNRIERRETTLGPNGEPHEFLYDAANRLTSSTRGLMDGSSAHTDYSLDEAHNLESVFEEVDGVEGQGVQAGEYARSGDAPELDAPVHQYTASPLEDLAYDLGGNLTSIRPRAPPRPGANDALVDLLRGLPPHIKHRLVEEIDTRGEAADEATRELRAAIAERGASQGGRDADLKWDWRNRLVEYVDRASGQTHRYRYDALGRRTLKVVDAGSLFPELRTTRFVYGGSAGASHWQVLEEQRPVGSSGWATAATYIYGNEIDEAIHVWKAPETTGGGSAGADYYLHHDDLSSATCATNAYGTVIERYRYGDYGAVTVRNADGSVRGDGSASNSVFANTRLFTGREYDVETGLYHFRNRYLDPSLARFISRDPIGVWGDEANLGNPLAYVGGRPWTVGDPYGEMSLIDRAIFGTINFATGIGDTVSFGASKALRDAVGLSDGVSEGSGAYKTGLYGTTAVEAVLGGYGLVKVGGKWVLKQFAKEAAEELAQKEADELARAALRPKPCPPPTQAQVTVNRAKGLAAEAAAEQQLRAQGNEILGRHVDARTAKGNREIDRLIRTPTDEIVAVEVKSGSGVRNASQIAKDNAMATTGATLVGKNAPMGFDRQMLIRTIVMHMP